MNTNNVVTADNPLERLRASDDESPLEELSRQEHELKSRTHDLHATLAIINGYSAALGSSFQELSMQYRTILEAGEQTVNIESADRLMKIEADCRFCLSRLSTSIDHLKYRLKTKHGLAGSSAESGL